MSFDMFLVSFRDGQKADADAGAARAVLAQVRYSHRAEFNAYDISFDDGSHLEMYVGGLDDGAGERFDGGMFALRGLSDAITAFVFDFARAAGCVIFPTMEPPCVLLPRADLEQHLPKDLRSSFHRVTIANADELAAMLRGGIDAWRAYRDHVIRTSRKAAATDHRTADFASSNAVEERRQPRRGTCVALMTDVRGGGPASRQESLLDWRSL
jgi:hypothetical protein